MPVVPSKKTVVAAKSTLSKAAVEKKTKAPAVAKETAASKSRRQGMPDMPESNRLTMKFLDDSLDVLTSWVGNLISELQAAGIEVSDLPPLVAGKVAEAKEKAVKASAKAPTKTKLVEKLETLEDVETVDLDDETVDVDAAIAEFANQ